MGALREAGDERDDCDHGYSDQNNLDWRQILFRRAEFLADVKRGAGSGRRRCRCAWGCGWRRWYVVSHVSPVIVIALPPKIPKEGFGCVGTRPFAQNAKERGTPNLSYRAV